MIKFLKTIFVFSLSIILSQTEGSFDNTFGAQNTGYIISDISSEGAEEIKALK